VHAALTRFHRAGGLDGGNGEPMPEDEALTLLGAALKFNGLSYEQGYQSCCSRDLLQRDDHPVDFLNYEVQSDKNSHQKKSLNP